MMSSNLKQALDIAEAQNLIGCLKKKIVLLKKENIILSKKLKESNGSLSRLSNDLQNAYMQTIKTLAQAIDARDHYTHSHSENVTYYAVRIARTMHLRSKVIEEIRQACELHDLGKIAIRDHVLSKSEPLTENEWVQIKMHSSKAAEILKPLKYLNKVIEIIRQHHERFDGTGYPEGLEGENIIVGARIISIADAYDAMTSARSYRKKPFTKKQAIKEMKHHSGAQFDPNIVNIFLKIVEML